jgi:sporulation protein YlmC with PRC-barrel domain
MTEKTTQFTIGSEVQCSDGVCGELRRVVVDPVSRTLTHLVVEPKHQQRAGHLVPVELVDPEARELVLQCTTAEFEALQDAEETRFLPGANGEWGYEQEQMLSWPYYNLGAGPNGLPTGAGAVDVDTTPDPMVASYERVPAGEVQVRRGEHVFATDGAIGRIQGLVVDPTDHHVTHVLLDKGHLWGQKRVAIPIGSVLNVDDGVRVSLTKDQVRDLPPVEVDSPE